MKRLTLILKVVALMFCLTIGLKASESSLSSVLKQSFQDPSLRSQSLKESDDHIEIRFDGVSKVSRSELVSALNVEPSISKDDLKNPDTLEQIVNRIKDFLAARGYIHATVTVHQDRSATNREITTFVINEGERARVEEIQFKGNNIFSSRELLDSMKVERKESSFTCAPQDEYDSEIFDYCLRRATFYMRSKGYLRSKLEEPKKQETEHGIKLIVPVSEGELYRIGNIKVEGMTVLTAEQILSLLNLKTGEPANSEEIGKWLQVKLQDAYGELGYIQYEYDVEPTFKDNPENSHEGIVDFQITISEGEKFFIRKISFKGTKPMSDEELLRLLSIHEGDTFSRKSVEDSVKTLNQLGLTTMDAERDVHYSTNHKDGLLDIIFDLNGREKQSPNTPAHPTVERKTSSPD